MATDIVMPALGMSQDTGHVVRWLKRPGEAVTEGEPLLEIETDKVTTEIEAPASGVLADVTAFEGDEVPVGQVIARVVGVGEVEAVGENSRPPVRAAEIVVAAAPGPAVARQSSPPAPTAVDGRPAGSPKARRLARERGVDLGRVAGSGPGGAVRAQDVLDAEPASAEAGIAAIRPGLLWQTMASRMAHSWRTVPHFYLSREIDAGGLVRARDQARLATLDVTVTDLLVEAAATALMHHPEVNSSWTEAGIVRHPRANIGVAVAVDEGLVVPVIHGAERLSISDIARNRRELVELARAGRLGVEDVRDGTFTISNLGMFGIDQFTAIINEPQAAILAVGAITDVVVLDDGQATSSPRLRLTLSCDHRVIDGARGARFLATIAEVLDDGVTAGA